MLTLSPERMRWVRRAAINAGFGLVVFIIALYVSFPYGRVKEMVVNMAAAQDLDVEIGSAGPGFFAVVFKDIKVSTRPTTGKPTRFLIESARVGLSPLSLLSMAPSGISMEAFGGQIEIEQQGKPGKKGPFHVELHAHDINLKEVPVSAMPLSGTLQLDAVLSSATGHYVDATGKVTFACKTCVLGDGKTPLRVEGNPFLSGGLTLPRLQLGDLAGHADIEKGTAKLKGVEAKSPDGELAIEGDVSLRDPLPSSMLNLYIRFKLSEPFLKRAENVRTILQMAASSGKRPDGSYGVRLGGTFARPGPPVFSTTSPTAPPAMPRPIQRPNFATPSLGSPPPPPPPPPAMPPPAMAEPPPPPPPAAEPPPPPPPPVMPTPAAPPPAPETVQSPSGEPVQGLRGTPPPAAVVDAPPSAPVPTTTDEHDQM